MLLKEEVDEEDIAQVVAHSTGIPVSKLMEGEVAKLLKLSEHLHERVVGQDEAVDAVSDAVVRARAVLPLSSVAKPRLNTSVSCPACVFERH